ncbi:hypothetical protein E4T80_11755 [Muribacter muris]|uniref:Uncharacterized protein n=1 Tax=Muribacter muris TaxID=67855 RepID=A0A4Y9JTK4_9PAST|nr:hypothetical protein [Muribacter muris]MBF0786133.1 hypothetical protein [Muribacter muris]MBF0827346.1 hypothetical protein [Muribacter muris]TFV07806.1 hypothetical protein E4T80_11755 [Muribacter muris]
MITSILKLFKSDEPFNWKNHQSYQKSACDPLQDIKAQITSNIQQGLVYRKAFIDTKLLNQLNVSPNDSYWETPETDLTQMYQAIQAATEIGYYFTIVSPTPWKRVLLVDIRQIPIRYIQNEWSNNQDWSVN